MRTAYFTLISLAVLFGHADAQRPGGRMRLDRMTLLGVEEVQDELQMSAEQNEAIQAATKQLGTPPRPQGPAEELDEQGRQEQRERMQQREAQERELIDEILTEEQQGRLKQIMLQVLGSRALFSSEVREALAITDEQHEEMAETRDEASSQMREKMQELFQRGRGDFAKRREMMQELREDLDEKVLSHLSEEQQAKLEEMKGEAFELSMEALFRSRGGPGRRPRGDRPQRPERPPIDS